MLLAKQEEVQKDIMLWTGKLVPLYATSEVLKAEDLGIKLPSIISHSNSYLHLSICIIKINPPNVQGKKPP